MSIAMTACLQQRKNNAPYAAATLWNPWESASVAARHILCGAAIPACVNDANGRQKQTTEYEIQELQRQLRDIQAQAAKITGLLTHVYGAAYANSRSLDAWLNLRQLDRVAASNLNTLEKVKSDMTNEKEGNNNMDMTRNIKLSMVQDVTEFVRRTNRFPYKQELRSGRYVVDAKSILGVMSLDLSRPIEYWCEVHDPELAYEIHDYVVRED